MAELALGAIPLAALAISGFKAVHSQLKAYKNADRMVRRWDRELRAHARTFKEACRSALGHVVHVSILTQTTTVSEMLKNPLDAKWSDPELGRELAEWLGPERFRDWVETVTDIKEVIRDLTATLEKFSTVLASSIGQDERVASQKMAVLGQRLKASFQEKDVQKSLDELGKLNRQLCDLQKDLPGGRTVLVPRRHGDILSVIRRNQQFQDLGQKRRALSGLHGGIIGVWRCSANETRHAKHSIKLFLDSGTTGAKLGYAYQPGDDEIRMLELQVRSNAVVPKQIDMAMAHLDVGGRDKDGGQGDGKRRKVLRWADEVPEAKETQAPETGQPTAPEDVVVNFRCCSDLCYSMTQPVVKVCPVNGIGSLGHIDTHAHEGFRHSFFPTVRDICGRPGCSLLTSDDVLTIHDILDQRIDGYLQVKDRIRLAKCLIEMVLTLHSTPWLAKSWELQDINFVRRGDDLVASLESLHVETELKRDHQSPGGPPVVEGYPADDPMSLEAGGTARNEQLWSLGMALLQTDTWSKITCRDEGTVMHLLKGRTSIGVRFREITERCLTGRFHCGSTDLDLNNPHLESELVEIVDEMGDMVKTLEQLGL